MAIKKYELSEITPIIKEMFPIKSCKDMYCNFNANSLGSLYSMTSGLLSGNNIALSQIKKIAQANYRSGSDDDLDYSSSSKFLYYNNDKKEY